MIPRTVASCLVVAFLLSMAPTVSASPVTTNDLTMDVHPDPPRPPWSVQAVGDTTNAYLFLGFCTQDRPGLNPFEGKIVTSTRLPETPPELELESFDPLESTYKPPPLLLLGQECTKNMILADLSITVVEEFEGTLSVTLPFEVDVETDGDIGTYRTPDPVVVEMELVLEWTDSALGSV